MAGTYRNQTEKREDAKLRQEKSNSFTPQQKIENLNKRLGVGKGAVRERAKLNFLIVNTVEAKKK